MTVQAVEFFIAAMVAGNNGTMFFKMRGNAELTEAQKGDFIKWVAAVCNGQRESKAAPPMSAAAGCCRDRPARSGLISV